MSNEPKHTATPIETIEEFIAREGYQEGTISQEIFDDGVRLGAKWQSEQSKSELESLRAENAELIEALRTVKDSAMMPDSVLDLVETTLAKYEKP